LISQRAREDPWMLQQTSAAYRAMAKEVRAIRKKLQQIEMLEMKQSNDYLLDEQQKAKVQTIAEGGLYKQLSVLSKMIV
jgi:hypothetical protein